jgi:hypothetical protein
MNLEEYKKQFKKDDAVGWISIDNKLEEIYPKQAPEHFAPLVSYSLGGEDPLDGISIYKSDKQENHFHFVSYGFSNLYYDEEAVKDEFSKWGFELTFRLKPFEQDNGDPKWVLALMQNLAKYIFSSKKWFEEYHFIPANGPIRLNTETEITALAFVLDPELGTINTPNGSVSFLQMVGITSAEYETLMKNPKKEETKKLLDELIKSNPLLITDLSRK